MDSHISYLPLMLEAHQRAQQQEHIAQGSYSDPRQNPIASTRANLTSTSSLPLLPASRTTLQPSQPAQISPQNLARAPPRETAQYAVSSASSGASSASSPPTATTTPMTFERRTRRRRSFRGAANKLARRKSATNGTKVGTIPEDPSSASGTDSKAASEKVSLRSYQYRAFHQADTGSSVPNGDEYAPYHAPPLPAPKAPSEGEYTFLTPQGGPQPSTSSLATSISTSSEPPARKSRTLAALALGKRAFREVLGGGGNNPTETPVKVTYFGRGGAGTRRSGQLPTIRADSFTPTKSPPNGLPIPPPSRSPGYQGSVVSSSGYAPSIASAPYTSTQSFGGSSPILSHRSLSPNMFGGSRLSVSSYSGTYATSLYEEDGPEGWQAPYNGHAQDPRVSRGSQLEVAYPHGPGDIKEESEEYDSESVGAAGERIPETLTYNGPGGEVYIVEQDYSNYPSQDEKHLQPPSNQPYYRDYRSPSTAGSSSNESTPLVHAKDGVLPGLSPPAATLLPQVPANVPRELPTPLKHQPSNDTLFQTNQAALYRQDVPGGFNGATVFGAQGNIGLMPQSLDPNTALQIQALYANFVAAGATPQNQLYPQQYTTLQNNIALLNNIVANGGVLGQSELANALAQLTLLTQPSMQPQQAMMSSVDQLPPPPTYTPYSTNTAPSFSLPSSAVPEMGVQPNYANYQPTPVAQHMNSKDVELAQTLARKRELEKKLLELEIQRLQREQALAPHTISSYSNNPDMPSGPNYY